MLKAADINVRVNCALLRDDGSTTLYGTATRTARKYFAVFRLDLDAGGNIIARDIRDFTTRATYLYLSLIHISCATCAWPARHIPPRPPV